MSKCAGAWWPGRVASKARLVVPAALVIFAGCATASLGGFTWVDDYVAPPVSDGESEVIAPGDVIDVRVFNQSQMSARAPVRNDGRVTLPFLNDVVAAGYAPTVLAQQLQTRFKDFVRAPIVTVFLEKAKPPPISVVGKVARPGPAPYTRRMGVLQALALAGGLTEFACKDCIFVLRRHEGTARIRFRYRDLLRGFGAAGQFELESGDTIVAE